MADPSQLQSRGISVLPHTGAIRLPAVPGADLPTAALPYHGFRQLRKAPMCLPCPPASVPFFFVWRHPHTDNRRCDTDRHGTALVPGSFLWCGTGAKRLPGSGPPLSVYKGYGGRNIAELPYNIARSRRRPPCGLRPECDVSTARPAYASPHPCKKCASLMITRNLPKMIRL